MIFLFYFSPLNRHNFLRRCQKLRMKYTSGFGRFVKSFEWKISAAP